MSATGSEKSVEVSGEGSGKENNPRPEDPDDIYGQLMWPNGPNFTYQYSEEWPMSFGSEVESFRGAEEEFFYPIYIPQEEEGGAEEVEEEEEEEYETHTKGRRKLRAEKKSSAHDTKSKSLFVHSFPSHFPDVTKARKSAFGSIFLKTSTEARDFALLRSIADNSYVRLSSLLDAFEKIIADANTDNERRRFTINFKESLLKTLEVHGISRTYSDGSVHWDVYPITQSYLFPIYMKDRLHQTRDLTRMEERILEGPARELKLPFSWPTKSIWSGYWNALGMTSRGLYSMPHGVSYFGNMQDGMFHDTNATLTYPNKFKAVNCVFDKGKLLSCQFQFPDSLVYAENWKYCKFPDRRFWSEVQNGLNSAKAAQKTQIHPPRTIPQGCYDTGDGFYNPKTLMLESPSGKLLRVPVCEEDLWIKKYCRKGFFEFANFRPDLFENWFNYDQNLIDSILNQQAAYRAGKITYSDLQKFYAELDLVFCLTNYQKQKTDAEIKLEEFMNSIPEPIFLKSKREKKYHGHKLQSVPYVSSKESKSSDEISGEFLEEALKISFTSHKTKSDISSKSSMESTKRKIPEKWLKYQPVLKLPFEPRRRDTRKKCLRTSRKSSSSSSGEIYIPAEGSESYVKLLERKNLQKYMKTIILDVVTGFLKKERERHRKRFVWGQKITSKKKKDPDSDTMTVLKQLFDSIPDKDEYCDSDPKKTCDLKELAQDKYNMLKYWGKRILLLECDEEPPEEIPKRRITPNLELTVNADAELLFAAFLRKDK